MSSRPSRFDRKYLFPLPSVEERELYCEYWRQKLRSKPAIQYPHKLCPAIAGITDGFSFAYLQEAFVATLLAIAGHRSEGDLNGEIASVRGGGGGGHGGDDDDDGSDLDDFELWREMKRQVRALRDDMSNNCTAIGEYFSIIPPSSVDQNHISLPSRARGAASQQRTGMPEAVLFDRDGNAVSRALVGMEVGGAAVKEGVKMDGMVRDGMVGELPMWDCVGRMMRGV